MESQPSWTFNLKSATGFKCLAKMKLEVGNGVGELNSKAVVFPHANGRTIWSWERQSSDNRNRMRNSQEHDLSRKNRVEGHVRRSCFGDSCKARRSPQAHDGWDGDGWWASRRVQKIDGVQDGTQR